MSGTATTPLGDNRGQLPSEPSPLSVAIIIPSYRVRRHIDDVLKGAVARADHVYVVDDACPEHTGDYVMSTHPHASNVTVLRHEVNAGVGAATVTGIKRAIADGHGILIKMDGDGQMSPEYVPAFVDLIANGHADYVKGNRFASVESTRAMPVVRRTGNIGLSFIAKLSTGYWSMMDPTNGFFGLHAGVAHLVNLDKLHQRYFFETDLLYRLNVLGARVLDIPMMSHYGDEKSNMNVSKELGRFSLFHGQRLVKRILLKYFIYDFNLASLQLLFGLPLAAFGVVYGIGHWNLHGPAATAGTVMLAGLSFLSGLQLLLSFVAYDISSEPKTPLHLRLGGPLVWAFRRGVRR